VAAGIKLNLFVKLHPHAHRIRLRHRKLKPVRPSRANELWYKAELLRIVRLLRKSAQKHLLPVLKLLTSANDGIGDATPPAVASQFNAMRMEFGGIEGVAQRLAKDAVIRNLKTVDERLKAAIKEAVKVDVQGIFANDHELREAMSKATKANIELITSIPEQYFDKLEKAVSDNFIQGVHYEALAAEVERIADITESRAKLIARDQTSKMNSAFNSIRQQQVGIEKYSWQTMEDERVRESHAELDGQTFRWDSPPDIDGEPLNPGEDIDCRCLAVPNFDLDEEDE
jgi:SPP1 gp7 family putative phage head morphogenesis protein